MAIFSCPQKKEGGHWYSVYIEWAGRQVKYTESVIQSLCLLVDLYRVLMALIWQH